MFLLCVYIFCHLRKYGFRTSTMGGIYDTVFTELQLEVKDEVAFMNAAKKMIPQLLRKYSSVHIKIGRRREDNRNKPDLTKLV